MINIHWSQLCTYEDFQIFSLSYHFQLIIFGFWSVGQTDNQYEDFISGFRRLWWEFHWTDYSRTGSYDSFTIRMILSCSPKKVHTTTNNITAIFRKGWASCTWLRLRLTTSAVHTCKSVHSTVLDCSMNLWNQSQRNGCVNTQQSKISRSFRLQLLFTVDRPGDYFHR